MVAEFVTPADVAVFNPGLGQERAAARIRSLTARAVAMAPCLAGNALTDDQRELVRSVILDAVLRWADTGSGALTQQSAGPFQVSTDSRPGERRGAFLRSEVDDLTRVCDDITGSADGAFSIHLGGARLPGGAPRRVDWDTALTRGWVEP